MALILFLRLADTTDVVVEAFRPGVVKRLGIDYETLAARNPKIVYCSISAFGQNNSKSQKPAHDLTVQGMAGLADLNRGLKDDLPAMPNIPFADAAGSMMALSAVLMALLRRHATGQGDYIDVAMYDACLSWTPNVMGPVFGEGRHPDPKNMRSFGGSAMYNIYETADGAFLILGGSEIKFATNLLDALGRSDLLDYAKLEPGPGQAPLRDFFAKTFASKSLDEWKAFLEPIDCCWSWVRSLKEAFDDPFTVEREMVVTDADGNRHIGVPVKFLLEPGKLDHRIPEYGQHSEDIARGAGLESKTVKDMQDRGVI